jgi:mannose-6-phosphate isomerase class I
MTETLPEIIAKYPNEILGSRARGHCEVLLKLLDAKDPLSLQIHPEDQDPNLKPSECGKPESWYILDAEPSAGLYLGFNRPLTTDELREILHDGDKAKDVLQFVKVKPGDYFEISAGTPHAIGGGVTLLEPQRIVLGKSGKTYRMWDWGRRYDAEGKQTKDQSGKARELHIEESLKLFDPRMTVGMPYVQTLRRFSESKSINAGVNLKQFPKNAHYQLNIIDLKENASCFMETKDGYGVFTVLSGSVHMYGKLEKVFNQKIGQTSLLPHYAMPMRMRAESASTIALITPSYSDLELW